MSAVDILVKVSELESESANGVAEDDIMRATVDVTEIPVVAKKMMDGDGKQLVMLA